MIIFSYLLRERDAIASLRAVVNHLEDTKGQSELAITNRNLCVIILSTWSASPDTAPAPATAPTPTSPAAEPWTATWKIPKVSQS